MEEWKEYKLKDVTTILGDGLHGTPKYDKNGNVFFINGNNLVDGKIEIKDSTKRVSEDEANKYRRNLNHRTILVSINGTIGNVAKYKGETCILGKSACYFNVAEDFDLDFIYYVVASKQFRNTITRLATGTTIKNVSLETMRNYSFVAPSINGQKSISSMLSSLDNKIELNHRINDNLEQQAQALFKSWFVDTPNPDWEETTLSEVASFIGGYSYKGDELADSSDIAMATIKNFGRNGGFKVDGFKDITPSTKLKECQYVDMFDVLVAHTDLTQNADVIGNAELLLTYGKYDRVIFSMDLVKVLPKNNFPYKFLLAAMLKNKIFKGHCLGYVNGTTVLHLNKKALPEFEIRIPSEYEARTMNDTLTPYFEQMAGVLQENERLIRLRDTLLPKLMSGELKISDIETAYE
ncbi:restriction endonuclease subunit S [Parabacteroides distasonis]|uniref:Type I restriction modification DNA specificity domain-containing protein n=1 Tax=Parabacteroides distasonis TaxID=823 RepID=A0A6I2N6B9_PARDI|nr:restriction endonuclease subunit S [Parabacteroides distasonis]MRY83503.1 hypothetical protein [Parabacteroides distasonis]MRZ05879.1 hypothetical protein [Parabacteroides distasonis]